MLNSFFLGGLPHQEGQASVVHVDVQRCVEVLHITHEKICTLLCIRTVNVSKHVNSHSCVSQCEVLDMCIKMKWKVFLCSMSKLEYSGQVVLQ